MRNERLHVDTIDVDEAPARIRTRWNRAQSSDSESHNASGEVWRIQFIMLETNNSVRLATSDQAVEYIRDFE